MKIIEGRCNAVMLVCLLLPLLQIASGDCTQFPSGCASALSSLNNIFGGVNPNLSLNQFGFDPSESCPITAYKAARVFFHDLNGDNVDGSIIFEMEAFFSAELDDIVYKDNAGLCLFTRYLTKLSEETGCNAADVVNMANLLAYQKCGVPINVGNEDPRSGATTFPVFLNRPTASSAEPDVTVQDQADDVTPSLAAVFDEDLAGADASLMSGGFLKSAMMMWHHLGRSNLCFGVFFDPDTGGGVQVEVDDARGTIDTTAQFCDGTEGVNEPDAFWFRSVCMKENTQSVGPSFLENWDISEEQNQDWPQIYAWRAQAMCKGNQLCEQVPSIQKIEADAFLGCLADENRAAAPVLTEFDCRGPDDTWWDACELADDCTALIEECPTAVEPEQPPPAEVPAMEPPPPTSTASPPPTSTASPPPTSTASPPPSSTASPPPTSTASPPPTSTASPPPISTASPPPTSMESPPPTYMGFPPPPLVTTGTDATIEFDTVVLKGGSGNSVPEKMNLKFIDDSASCGSNPGAKIEIGPFAYTAKPWMRVVCKVPGVDQVPTSSNTQKLQIFELAKKIKFRLKADSCVNGDGASYATVSATLCGADLPTMIQQFKDSTHCRLLIKKKNNCS